MLTGAAQHMLPPSNAPRKSSVLCAPSRPRAKRGLSVEVAGSDRQLGLFVPGLVSQGWVDHTESAADGARDRRLLLMGTCASRKSRAQRCHTATSVLASATGRVDARRGCHGPSSGSASRPLAGLVLHGGYSGKSSSGSHAQPRRPDETFESGGLRTKSPVAVPTGHPS